MVEYIWLRYEIHWWLDILPEKREKLNVYDVAKDTRSVVKKKLAAKLNWLGSYREDISANTGYDCLSS